MIKSAGIVVKENKKADFSSILLEVDMMVLNWILYVYVGFFTVYSLIYKTNSNPVLLILCCMLFFLSFRFRPMNGFAPWLRLFMVCCLHWTLQIQWCLPIYLLTMAKDTFMEENRAKAWALSLAYAIANLATTFFLLGPALSPLPGLIMLISSFHFLAAALLSRYILSVIKQTEILKHQQKIFSTQDALTGLYNYEECHKRLSEYIETNIPLLLILIDCTDLKSMNTAKGFQAGNLILKQVSELLKILFSDAYFISRYGGDEFAIVMPLKDQDQVIESIKQQLDYELPRLTGIQITYGLAVFTPQQGTSKDDLIVSAEDHL